MTHAKDADKPSLANPAGTKGDFDTLERARNENAKSIPPEDRKQKGAPMGQPVAAHEPPTYENKGSKYGSATDHMTPGKAHGDKRK